MSEVPFIRTKHSSGEDIRDNNYENYEEEMEDFDIVQEVSKLFKEQRRGNRDYKRQTTSGGQLPIEYRDLLVDANGDFVRNDLSSALSKCIRVTQRYPKYLDAWRLRAEIAEMNRDVSEIFESFSSILELVPSDARAMKRIASLYLEFPEQVHQNALKSPSKARSILRVVPKGIRSTLSDATTPEQRSNRGRLLAAFLLRRCFQRSSGADELDSLFQAISLFAELQMHAEELQLLRAAATHPACMLPHRFEEKNRIMEQLVDTAHRYGSKIDQRTAAIEYIEWALGAVGVGAGDSDDELNPEVLRFASRLLQSGQRTRGGALHVSASLSTFQRLLDLAVDSVKQPQEIPQNPLHFHEVPLFEANDRLLSWVTELLDMLVDAGEYSYALRIALRVRGFHRLRNLLQHISSNSARFSNTALAARFGISSSSSTEEASSIDVLGFLKRSMGYSPGPAPAQYSESAEIEEFPVDLAARLAATLVYNARAADALPMIEHIASADAAEVGDVFPLMAHALARSGLPQAALSLCRKLHRPFFLPTAASTESPGSDECWNGQVPLGDDDDAVVDSNSAAVDGPYLEADQEHLALFSLPSAAGAAPPKEIYCPCPLAPREPAVTALLPPRLFEHPLLCRIPLPPPTTTITSESHSAAQNGHDAVVAGAAGPENSDSTTIPTEKVWVENFVALPLSAFCPRAFPPIAASVALRTAAMAAEALALQALNRHAEAAALLEAVCWLKPREQSRLNEATDALLRVCAPRRALVLLLRLGPLSDASDGRGGLRLLRCALLLRNLPFFAPILRPLWVNLGVIPSAFPIPAASADSPDDNSTSDSKSTELDENSILMSESLDEPWQELPPDVWACLRAQWPHLAMERRLCVAVASTALGVSPALQETMRARRLDEAITYFGVRALKRVLLRLSELLQTEAPSGPFSVIAGASNAQRVQISLRKAFETRKALREAGVIGASRSSTWIRVALARAVSDARAFEPLLRKFAALSSASVSLLHGVPGESASIEKGEREKAVADVEKEETMRYRVVTTAAALEAARADAKRRSRAASTPTISSPLPSYPNVQENQNSDEDAENGTTMGDGVFSARSTKKRVREAEEYAARAESEDDDDEDEEDDDSDGATSPALTHIKTLNKRPPELSKFQIPEFEAVFRDLSPFLRTDTIQSPQVRSNGVDSGQFAIEKQDFLDDDVSELETLCAAVEVDSLQPEQLQRLLQLAAAAGVDHSILSSFPEFVENTDLNYNQEEETSSKSSQLIEGGIATQQDRGQKHGLDVPEEVPTIGKKAKPSSPRLAEASIVDNTIDSKVEGNSSAQYSAAELAHLQLSGKARLMNARSHYLFALLESLEERRLSTARLLLQRCLQLLLLRRELSSTLASLSADSSSTGSLADVEDSPLVQLVQQRVLSVTRLMVRVRKAWEKVLRVSSNVKARALALQQNHAKAVAARVSRRVASLSVARSEIASSPPAAATSGLGTAASAGRASSKASSAGGNQGMTAVAELLDSLSSQMARRRDQLDSLDNEAELELSAVINEELSTETEVPASSSGETSERQSEPELALRGSRFLTLVREAGHISLSTPEGQQQLSLPRFRPLNVLSSEEVSLFLRLCLTAELSIALPPLMTLLAASIRPPVSLHGLSAEMKRLGGSSPDFLQRKRQSSHDLWNSGRIVSRFLLRRLQSSMTQGSGPHTPEWRANFPRDHAYTHQNNHSLRMHCFMYLVSFNLASKSSKSAVSLCMEAARIDPTRPVIWLAASAGILGQVTSRMTPTPRKVFLFTQLLLLLRLYHKLRVLEVNLSNKEKTLRTPYGFFPLTVPLELATAEARYNLGRALQQVGLNAQALHFYKEALEVADLFFEERLTASNCIYNCLSPDVLEGLDIRKDIAHNMCILHLNVFGGQSSGSVDLHYIRSLRKKYLTSD